ncbi:MAG: hypothetical protein R2705_16185 [Ilumatobacteraceae bacterium]
MTISATPTGFAAQRERLRATIAELEQRQDALLDELSSGRTG